MLKKIAAVSMLAITVSQSPATASDFKRVKAKSDFANIFVDRKGVASWGWVASQSDGTIVGKVNGERASGSWEWKNGFWCRTISWGSAEMPYDCQAVFHKNGTGVFIRNKGQGEQTVVKLQ